MSLHNDVVIKFTLGSELYSEHTGPMIISAFKANKYMHSKILELHLNLHKLQYFDYLLSYLISLM